VTVGTLKAGASTAEDVFPRLPPSPKKGAAIFSLVHPNSLTLQKLNNGNSNHLRPKWHHYTNCPPARKHERDSPQSSNPGPGPAKNARLPGKSGRKPRVFPAITPMRLPELSPSPINPLHNPFLSPQVANDLVESLTSPAVLDLSIYDEDYVTAQPLSHTPSPLTSPAQPSPSAIEDESSEEDVSMDISDDEREAPDSPLPGTPSGLSSKTSSSYEASPTPARRPHGQHRRHLLSSAQIAPNPPCIPAAAGVSLTPVSSSPGEHHAHSTPAILGLLRDGNGVLLRINGVDSLYLWAGFDAASGTFWRAYSNPFLIITLITHLLPADLAVAKDEIHKVIVQYTGATNPIIAIPTFSGGTVRPLVVTGLTTEEILILTKQQIWVTATVAFAAWPSTNFSSRYMLTLINLDIPVDDAVAAQNVIVTALTGDALFKSFILTNRDAYPSHWSEDRCLLHSLHSVRCVGRLLGVRGSEKKSTTFDVYFDPPTNNPAPLNKLYTYLRSRKFPTIWGTATARPAYECSTCLGQDHPTGLCSYPKLPGWPMSSDALQVALDGPPPSTRLRQTHASISSHTGNNQRRGGNGETKGPSALRGRGGKQSGRSRT